MYILFSTSFVCDYKNEKALVIFQRKIATPEKPEGPKPPSRGPIETITSPYDRFTPRQGYPDTPALRQLR
jgi:arginine-glutamic acid dipeptide repeat-containing protein